MPTPDGIKRVSVAADLADGDWGERLIAAGFEPNRPSGPDAESFLSGLGWKLEYRQGSIDFARIGRPLPPEEVTDLLVGTRAATASG